VKVERLYELARSQGGVFARWQAIDLGFSHYAVARRLEAKEWRRVFGTVLAQTGSVLGPASMEWAAYLACGPNSVLSGPSAIRKHGLDVETKAEGTCWVTVPAERHVRLPSSVRTIREAVDAQDVIEVDGMRVTSVPRSIVDTLRVVPDRVGRPILDWALLQSWITLDELDLRVLTLTGRRGVGRLRRHLVRVRDGARSEAERRLHKIIADIPGWVAGHEVVDRTGRLVAVLDVAFPDVRLAVEIDGLAFHSRPRRFQADRTRQNALTRLKWRILRYTWDDVMDRPEWIKRQILDELDSQDPTERSGFRVSSEI
jgi:hypothetical protein